MFRLPERRLLHYIQVENKLPDILCAGAVLNQVSTVDEKVALRLTNYFKLAGS